MYRLTCFVEYGILHTRMLACTVQMEEKNHPISELHVVKRVDQSDWHITAMKAHGFVVMVLTRSP